MGETTTCAVDVKDKIRTRKDQIRARNNQQWKALDKWKTRQKKVIRTAKITKRSRENFHQYKIYISKGLNSDWLTDTAMTYSDRRQLWT